MKNENIQLCPNCQTGLESYLLDNRIPECPYMILHNGIYCGMYKSLTNAEKEKY